MQPTDNGNAKVLIYVKKNPVEVVNNPAASFICYICVVYLFLLLSKTALVEKFGVMSNAL